LVEKIAREIDVDACRDFTKAGFAIAALQNLESSGVYTQEGQGDFAQKEKAVLVLK
jgi:hypothetical protein